MLRLLCYSFLLVVCAVCCFLSQQLLISLICFAVLLLATALILKAASVLLSSVQALVRKICSISPPKKDCKDPSQSFLQAEAEAKVHAKHMNMEEGKRMETNEADVVPSSLHKRKVVRRLGRSLSYTYPMKIPELEVLQEDGEPVPLMQKSPFVIRAAGDRTVGALAVESVSVAHISVAKDPNPSATVTLIKPIVRAPSLTSEEVNQQAEAFIAGFHEQMRLQRQESYARYQERLDRSAG